MRAKIKLLFFPIIFLHYMVLSSCSQSNVTAWVNKQISLDRYSYIEVAPVTNASERTIPKEVPLLITEYLKTHFESSELTSDNSTKYPSEVLIARSEVLNFVGCEITSLPVMEITGPLRNSMCSLRTQLIDKNSGNIVAEITITKEAPGCYLHQHRHQKILDEVAKEIVNEVEKIMH